jgi:hypothetical protein
LVLPSTNEEELENRKQKIRKKDEKDNKMKTIKSGDTLAIHSENLSVP